MPLFNIVFTLILDSSILLIVLMLLQEVIMSSDKQLVSLAELGKLEIFLAYLRCFLSLLLLASSV